MNPLIGPGAILLIFVLMAFSGRLERSDRNRVEVIRMADKARQNARKPPLKRNAKYAMVWEVKRAKP